MYFLKSFFRQSKWVYAFVLLSLWILATCPQSNCETFYESPLTWQTTLVPDQQWENGRTSLPWVIYDQELSKYRMWYTIGHRYPPDNTNWFLGGIASAESTDGITWTDKQSLLVATTEWSDEERIFAPIVLKIVDEYWMYATQFYRSYGGQWSNYVVRRTSTNGTDWSEPVTVLDDTGSQSWERFNFTARAVMPDPAGGYRMFYSVNFQHWNQGSPFAYLATAHSVDGLNWTDRTRLIGETGQPLFSKSTATFPTIFFDALEGVYKGLYVNAEGNLTECTSADGIHWDGIEHGYDDVSGIGQALEDHPPAWPGYYLKAKDGSERLYFRADTNIAYDRWCL